MPAKKKSGSLANRYKKQHGLHHKHSGKYIKVYWPYLPVLMIVLFGISASIIILLDKPDTSVASASISINTLVNSTNKARQSAKLSPLKISSELTKAAQIKANDMAVNDYWAPISPSGVTPWQIIQTTGYKYQTAGENLAYGFNSASSLNSSWLNSPSHSENILNPNFSDVGFGVAVAPDYQNEGPETIVVAFYGSTNPPVTSTATHNDQTFTTASINQPNSQTIARAESLTNKNGTITIFVTGLIIGVFGCFLIVKHGLLLKKWAFESEELIIKHPFFDILLVVLLLGVASLNQTIGFIR